ncbi:MAG: sigma-54 dependent transcriptional regulator [Planctomycetes bacterium]|nr:sigma-54 dependent transcriptional regulator [Planctomycetota bacterium]
MMERALVVDDEALSREYLQEALESMGLEVRPCANGRDALKAAEESDFDLVISDMRMPGLDGTGLLKELRSKGHTMPVVIVTAYGTIETAVDAMREGATDFLLKPFSVDQIEVVLEKLKTRHRLEEENRYLRSRDAEEWAGGMVCVSPAMKAVVEVARQAADSKATVLITGESGTGKEVLSRFIHESSPRRQMPYIKVNCAALSENLLESELFGHEQGAFTGAVRRRKGRFELAAGGTLLLDEISEIMPSLQAKLLRVLEEEEFERVGGVRTLRTDVRVIATTNRDLEREMEEDRFRHDLFYRLNVVPVEIPPLRERCEEIPVLAEHFLRRFAQERGKPVIHLSKEAAERLAGYDWPGNVRELRNVLQRVAILGDVQVLETGHLERLVHLPGNGVSQAAVPMGRSLEEMEKEMILSTLEANDGCRKETARLLGITTRTLSNKIRTYRLMGLPVPARRITV